MRKVGSKRLYIAVQQVAFTAVSHSLDKTVAPFFSFGKCIQNAYFQEHEFDLLVLVTSGALEFGYCASLKDIDRSTLVRVCVRA